MEKSEIVVIKAIEQLGSTEIHSSLRENLESLETEKIESLLNIESNNKLIKTDNEIRKIVSKAKNNAIISDNGEITELSTIVQTANLYFVKSIEGVDLKSLILFLNINCYLLANIKYFLQHNDYSSNDTKGIAEKIIELLNKISFDIKAQSGVPYHEKEMLKEYEEGIKNNNIKNTYSLIEAIERGGKGFHFNFLLEHIVKALYILNFGLFIKALKNLSSPQSFIFCLQSFTREQLFAISEEKSLTNKWFNFELIRQTTRHELEENLNNQNVRLVKNCLLKLVSDTSFFKQSVLYFPKSKIFNNALAETLALNSNKLQEDIISDCFEISKHTFYHEAKNIFKDNFKKSATEDRYLEMLEQVHNKWETFYNKISNSDEYQDDLLLTDYCDFIVEYFYEKFDDSDIIDNMNNCFNDLQYIVSIWTESQTQQITTFNLLLTRLYLLTYAFKGKEMNNKEMLKSFSDFESNSILISRFIEDKRDALIKVMKENIESTNR
ncbi:hypothetical protein DFQ09_111135 [Winogradskyella pacifica]|uniref:Uncharacterized protein n=1 Tax=Winogradskyella pacifica TaxID=664642 RepID=A0A3D9LKM5_9FLAO|nr:hypothetical protein [Winogradskyella pacifica]REE07805.1 hypothetical protein DFQ09_111135 [Winogradskyella pacifica]